MAREKMTLKVAGKSNPKSVAGSIAKNLQEGKDVEVVAVGAGAVNQAVKAIAIARGFVASQGIDLWMKPAFLDLEIEGETKTGMCFILEAR